VQAIGRQAHRAPAGAPVNCEAFDGTYGDYLIGKVSKMFPELKQQVL